MHDDELWQLYGADGQPLEGQGLQAESPHDAAISLGLAIVWLWRLRDGVLELCLQKRALTKWRWPGMYSTSAGGHINVGETPQQAVLRECREEIGVTLDPAKLSYAGTFRVATEPQDLRSVFSYQIEGDIDFRFDDGEVDAVEWMSYDECMTRANDPNSQLVMRHYGMDYMKLMMDHILREAEKAKRHAMTAIRRAVILHGTDGSPTELAWQVWLQKQLEDSGYEVFFPLLPDNHTPSLQKYDEFLQNSGWDFTDNIVIGHSSGATALLHLLQQDWFPHIRAAVLVGTFLEESRVKSAAWYDPGQFDKLFIEEFQPERIRSGADKFYFVHGDDDPYCDYDLGQQLCEQVAGTFIAIPGGGHLASASGITELPKLIDALKSDSLL